MLAVVVKVRVPIDEEPALLVDGLKSMLAPKTVDPMMLMQCDSARVIVYPSAPVYGITGIQSGDLASALGLHDRDRLVSVNGISLGSKSDVIGAFAELWLANETEFILVVNRVTGTTTLTYELIP